MSTLRDTTAAPSTEKWLTVVGVGEDGIDGLPPASARAIAAARIVIGGQRHLELVQSIVTGETRAWPEPFDVTLAGLLGLRGQSVCVLASGDPLCFGVGATISRHLSADEFSVLPAPSAFSLAAARLGWPLQSVACISTHGRPLDLIRTVLHDQRRVLALTSDGASPGQICELLGKAGFGQSTIHVLEALGGPREQKTSCRVDAIGTREFDPLNVVALELKAGPDARVQPLGFGLADDLFVHDGQITKREVRAATLSALRPYPGQLLWDIGAGSGSISIEWMLAHPSLSAIAIEANASRAESMRVNARNLGVPGLCIVEGTAPQALTGLPEPDAIFVGGGGSEPNTMEVALAALKHGGRLVANSVTLEMERVLLGLHAVHGGELSRISVERAAPIGTMQGFRPAMTVTQWGWTKP
jgi:precorrin-6Y C5,15-methyltransferase (decarboxylating)